MVYFNVHVMLARSARFNSRGLFLFAVWAHGIYGRRSEPTLRPSTIQWRTPNPTSSTPQRETKGKAILNAVMNNDQRELEVGVMAASSIYT